MKKFLSLIILAVLLLTSCEKEELLMIPLKTQIIGVLEVTKSEKEDKFAYIKQRDCYEISIITSQIRKKQQIKTINSFYKGNELFIFILLDADLFPEPLDRITQVKFNLYDIPKKEYKLRIFVENVELYMIPNKCLFN